MSVVFVLAASLLLTVPYSYGGSKSSEPGVQEDLDSESPSNDESAGKSPEVSQNTSDQEDENPATAEPKDTSDAETNETSTVPSELVAPNDTSKETFNITSGILGQPSLVTKANLSSGPEILNETNQTRKVSKPGLDIQGEGLPTLTQEAGECPGSPGCPPNLPPSCPPSPPFNCLPNYAITEIKVTFTSMKVNDDHEGTFSGDGEYDIAAYIDGKRVRLSDASGPGSGLWDVSSGETVTFDASAEIMVDVESKSPLSILTVGTEKDNNCGSTDILPTVTPQNYYARWDPDRAQSSLQEALEDDEGIFCGALNSNDPLGKVIAVHQPKLKYPLDGNFLGDSDSKDFTLYYTIQTKRIK